MSWIPHQVNKLAARDYAADGLQTINIGGDPIDAVIITLSVDAVTDLPTLLQLLEVLDRLEIQDNGNPVKEFTSPEDALVMSSVRSRSMVRVHEFTNTDPSNTYIQWYLMFGRRLLDRDLAYPAREDEDVQLQLTVDDADTNVDNPQWYVDVLYKRNFTSKGWLKETTKTITQSATGEFDSSIEREGKLHGILFFGTTVPTDSADTATLEWIRYLENNVAVWYNQAYWEYLNAQLQARIGNADQYYGHTHRSNLAAMYTQNEDTEGAENNAEPFEQYAYMDFDLYDDSTLARDLTGLRTAQIKANFGDTNAARMIPVIMKMP